jgi:alkanesulfonate monooxygenase SsuD/methylene tetrahydromethanopterin reductase-like flavin-dependent oxidoreductase (luciferase family)
MFWAYAIDSDESEAVDSSYAKEEKHMLIGHYTEQPWQDPNRDIKRGGIGAYEIDRSQIQSNAEYDPELGMKLYNRYIDEKLAAEESGFDMLMLNEHHSAPFCMQGVTNVEAAILARQTKRAKIVILGNIIPVWDDPLWLAEQLAMIDMISRGRLISGWVRGASTESVSHNVNPTMNRERFNEAHDFIVKTWTQPGPFRWEGKHYQYRYVNPWSMPFQRPHPQIWIPGIASKETIKWCAERHLPYVMLATLLPATKEMFDFYREYAKELGYEAKTQNFGYLFKVHADDTEEMADQAGRRYIFGVNNPFIAGNRQATQDFALLPGLTSAEARARQARTLGTRSFTGAASNAATNRAPYEQQVEQLSIITGTPKTVLPKVRHVLETLRPGQIFLWDGDGAMTHDDQMRSLKHMRQEVLPAVREIGKELGLVSAQETTDGTGYDQAAWKRLQGVKA